MATNYPTSLDALTNPTSSDSMSSPSHSGQHADSNDAIEALQAKVGVDSSAVATSLDYRVAQLESGGGSMTTSATAPSSPSDGDMWYDTSTGRTYVYYDDGSSQQWVEFGATPDAGIMHVSSGAPSSPNAGDMWYDTDDGTTSLYYDDGSSQQWVQFGAAPVTTGKILQVVSTVKTDTWSASIAAGGSAAVTGLSATITPSSTSSKILVIANLHGMDGRDSITWVGMRVLRDGTAIGEATSAGSRSAVMGGSYNQSANGLNLANAHGTHLDSPNSTSALTYAVHAQRVSTHTGTVYVNRTPTDTNSASFMRTASSITLMEVSA